MTTRTYSAKYTLIFRCEADTAGEAKDIAERELEALRAKLPTGFVIEHTEFEDSEETA